MTRLPAVALAVLVAVGGCVLTEESLAIKKIARNVNERVYGFDRLVDVGVELNVIRLDRLGPITLESGRRVSVLRTHRWGGILDTKATTPGIVGISKAPRKWMCSEAQESIILHSDADPLGQLVLSGEGAGKTTALAMWHHRRWVIDGIGHFREGGQTAPVLKRLGLVKQEFLNLWDARWCHYVARDDFEGFELCDGSRIRFQHTHRQSQAAGSPIQGFNWSWAGRDEMQDQVDVHLDIESRGRAAKGGKYKQLGTATAKDDPEWKTLRDGLIAGGQWIRRELRVADSPFVAANFLEIKRKSAITDREFRRRYLAEDLAPESRLYFNWDRETNLRPVPLLGPGITHITSLVLSRKTGASNQALLIGHDPGTAKAASVLLQAYKLPNEPEPVWWVRGELITLHATTEQHGLDLLALIRKRFAVNLRPDLEQAHVRAQPIGQAEDKPDLDLYRIFKRVGLDTKAAQYKKDGTGTGHIKKDSRIGMINRLLCDAAGRRRLFIDCDEQRRPCAPRLVEAFETMERDERGRAEVDKRLDYDKSDPADALGYALWPWEKESAAGLRADITKGIG